MISDSRPSAASRSSLFFRQMPQNRLPNSKLQLGAADGTERLAVKLRDRSSGREGKVRHFFQPPCARCAKNGKGQAAESSCSPRSRAKPCRSCRGSENPHELLRNHSSLKEETGTIWLWLRPLSWRRRDGAGLAWLAPAAERLDLFGLCRYVEGLKPIKWNLHNFSCVAIE